MKKAHVRLKYALIMAIKRAYRNVKMIAVLIWDASKYAWSYTITQVVPEELAKQWSEQQHEILVTRSGLFKGSQIDTQPPVLAPQRRAQVSPHSPMTMLSSPMETSTAAWRASHAMRGSYSMARRRSLVTPRSKTQLGQQLLVVSVCYLKRP